MRKSASKITPRQCRKLLKKLRKSDHDTVRTLLDGLSKADLELLRQWARRAAERAAVIAGYVEMRGRCSYERTAGVASDEQHKAALDHAQWCAQELEGALNEDPCDDGD